MIDIDQVPKKLLKVLDPEVGIDIVDLGFSSDDCQVWSISISLG
ncbi:hypothetical protein [Alicyclobacillus mengziensis]|nr:hypothetical protein [Alicyclobacillus mengziensis]